MSATTPALEVLDPGLLLTVQDGGRPGLARDGITRGGAADRRSLAIANLLVGNRPDAAALEATLLGTRVRALRPMTVGLAGTMAGHVAGMPRAIEPGATITLAVGDVLELGAATGARGYLAVSGGIDVPVVLGSRSTVLGAGFGGLDGRALRPGDRLAAEDPDRVLPPGRWPGTPAPEPVDAEHPLRVVRGPDADELGHATLEGVRATRWTVSPTSDRVGIRLAGPPLGLRTAKDLATHGVTEGAVQVPPDGRPIVLLVDHQPTGGYPVVAVVITADLPRLGQLAPGGEASFELVTAAEARALLAAEREAMDETLERLRDAARGDDSRPRAGG